LNLFVCLGGELVVEFLGVVEGLEIASLIDCFGGSVLLDAGTQSAWILKDSAGYLSTGVGFLTIVLNSSTRTSRY
jgi:hypothetical protein